MKSYQLVSGLTFALLFSTVSAWAQTDYRFLPTGTATWDDGDNWENAAGQNFIPEANFNDRALINNGGTAFVDSSPPAPGAVVLGESAVGIGGNLEIRSGGTLDVEVGTSQQGEDPLNGGVTVGDASVGTLSVMPGGTLSVEGPLVSGANQDNHITLGASAGAGTANLTAGSINFGGTTRIYPNANIMSNDSLTFGGSGNYIAEIDGPNAALLDATGAATLAGSFRANFAGAPTVGSTWSLIEAESISDSFGSVDTNVQLPLGQSLFFTTSDIAGGRQQLDLNLAEVLVLEVNRDNGIATIRQPGSSTITIDGYSVLSSQGSLLTEGWDSLQEQSALDGGWTESNPTVNSLSELKAVGSGSLGNDAEVEIGSIYDPFVVPFGFTEDDLSFEYTTPGGETFQGIVELTGTLANNIVLQVDPVTGEARIRNRSGTAVDLDAYTIESASGSLTESTWSSLDEQNSAGGDWLELFDPPSDNMIGELKPSGGHTMGPGGDTFLEIGQIFDTGSGLRDLVFQYKEDGVQSGALGTIVYQEISENISGDLNGDGNVDGFDFLIAQRDDPSLISVVVSNYGSSEGALSGSQGLAAVPEPSSAALMMLLLTVSALRRKS